MTISDARKRINRIVREALPGLHPSVQKRVSKEIEEQVAGLVLEASAETLQVRYRLEAAAQMLDQMKAERKREQATVRTAIKTIQEAMERKHDT